MLGKFEGSIKVKRGGDKDTYTTLSGDFGTNIETCLMYILGTKKTLILFKDVKPFQLIFNTYFTLEVYETLVEMQSFSVGELPFYNRKVVETLIAKLKESNAIRYKQHTNMDKKFIKAKEKDAKRILDLKRVNKVMNFGILPHQEIAFKDYAYMKLIGQLRGIMLAADPGTGKTFMALALSVVLNVDRCIIVAPKNTLEEVWVDSVVGEMFKSPQDYWLSTDNNRYRGQKYIIVHYEYLNKLMRHIGEDGGNTMVILDESHNLNEKGTTRTRLFSEMLQEIKPTDVVLLSGTSIKGSFLEVSNILKYSDSDFSEEVEEIFEGLYKTPTHFLAKILPLRYTYVNTFISKDDMPLPPSETLPFEVELKEADWFTIEEIKKRMKVYAVERFKELDDDKEKYRKRYVELRDMAFHRAVKEKHTNIEDFQQYVDDINEITKRYENGGLADIPNIMRRANKYEKEIIETHLKEFKEFRDIKTIVKYVSYKIQGEILARIVMRTRIELSKAFAKNLDYKKYFTMSTKKTLMFSSYTEAAEIAYKEGSKIAGVLRVFGEHSKDLSGSVREFGSNKKIQALSTTYASLSTGVPITMANLTVFFDLPFKTYIYGQAIARTHRLGQDSACTFIQLLLNTGNEPNINSRDIDIIRSSKDIVEQVTSRQVDIVIKDTDEEEKAGNESDGVVYEEPLNPNELVSCYGNECEYEKAFAVDTLIDSFLVGEQTMDDDWI